MNKSLAVTLAMLSMVSIQGGSALAKSLFGELAPMQLLSLRLILAALLTQGLLLIVREKRQSPRWMLVPYGLSLAAMNAGFYLSINLLPLGLAMAILFCGPLAIATWSQRKERHWFPLALAALSLSLTALPGNTQVNVQGIAIALATAAAWAAYIYFGKSVSREYSAAQGSAWGLAIAATCLLPFGLNALPHVTQHPETLGLILAVAFFSSSLPYLLELRALQALPTTTFGLLMSLEPAIAGIWGLVLLREHLTVPEMLTCAGVIAANVVLLWQQSGRQTSSMVSAAPPPKAPGEKVIGLTTR